MESVDEKVEITLKLQVVRLYIKKLTHQRLYNWIFKN